MLKFIIIGAAMALALASQAQAADVEYKQFIKEDNARREKQFITSDNPAWTREDMQIRRAVKGKWYSVETKPETRTEVADNHQFINQSMDSVMAVIEQDEYTNKVKRLETKESYGH